MKLKSIFRNIFERPLNVVYQRSNHEKLMLLNGRILSTQNLEPKVNGSLADVEFSVFSQWGDDGIIQWLLRHIEFPNQTFIEFGVEDYRESNTRFLMMNNNWAGLVIDGSEKNISRIRNSEYFWKYDLQAKAKFITAENINELILSSGLAPEVGILHIDLDGNDYWIWRAIDSINPVIVIMEFNSVFGINRPITVPYDSSFTRTKFHYSNLYAGASLLALNYLSEQKGYSLIGCNSAGNNAYFVKNNYLNESIKKISIEQGFINSRFRESRSRNGQLSYLSGQLRLDEIRGLPVFNVVTNKIEKL